MHSDLTYDVPAAWDGKFFRLDDHLARLEGACGKIRLRLPLSKEEIKKILTDMLVQSGIKDAFIELIVTRGLKGVRGSKPGDIKENLYMFIMPCGLLPPETCPAKNAILTVDVPDIWVQEPEMQLTGGDAVIARTVRRTPPGAFDPTVKNLQWGDLTRAMHEAQDRGATYPFLTDGDAHLTEGSGFNICVIKDGVIYTPDRGVLEGITRKSVIDAATANGIEVRLEAVPVELCYKADEIFMCTTAGGIMPITLLEGKPVKDGKIGPVTKKIWDTYWAMHWDPTYTIAINYNKSKL